MRAHGAERALFFTFSLLAAQKGLIHGFSTRQGSADLHGLAQAMGFDEQRLVLTRQTHTVNILEATEAEIGWPHPDIDGLFTAIPNLPLMTRHADCAALFFYCPRPRLIGLAHAGWRGTADNMARVMIEAMVARGCDPAAILAGIGPSAGPCCYQVGEDVAARFFGLNDEQGPLITPEDMPGKYKLDLWRANRLLMLQAGLTPQNIEIGGLCTVCHPELFYSHRLLGFKRGTMAAVMMLKGE